jgi:hypothetical protein
MMSNIFIEENEQYIKDWLEENWSETVMVHNFIKNYQERLANAMYYEGLCSESSVDFLLTWISTAINHVGSLESEIKDHNDRA